MAHRVFNELSLQLKYLKMNMNKNVSDLLDKQKVVPVVVIENQEQAEGLANALLEGGVNVIEITLRNAYGVEAIRVIKQVFSDMVVLAGTVNTVEQMQAVIDAGVDGVISPGISEALIKIAEQNNVPYLPGVATASDLMLAAQHGLTECKLFPATVVGGISALKAFAGPFSDIQFCPTGGINEDNYQDFLSLPNVMCVGGSWIAPGNLVRSGDWQEITERCRSLQSQC